MKRYVKAAITGTHHSKRGRVQHPRYVLGCVHCQSSDLAADVIDSAIRNGHPDTWHEGSSSTGQIAVAALELALGEQIGDRIATPSEVRASGGWAR